MTGSPEIGHNPLLEQADQNRAAALARKESEKRAEGMLPGFKTHIGELITKHVPAPEQITRKISRFNFDDDYRSGRSDDGPTLDTKLTAIIPIPSGETTLTILASGYPNAEDPTSAQRLQYEVSLTDLDFKLVISQDKAVIRSKKTEYEPFNINETRMGSRQKSWPAWERPVQAEDLEGHEVLFNSLDRDGITFDGSTPPVITRDYSQLRKDLGHK